MPEYCHLHNHTQYSLLDGASDIPLLFKKAKKDNQKAVAITDHGNMFGVFKFVKEAKKTGIKPIIGCEFYIVQDRHIKSFEKSRGLKDIRYHQLLLAKNEIGYNNLSKMCSIGYKEGLYGKYPRIDHEIIVNHREGLIATSCCIGAEIPQAILSGNIELAETKLKWWLDLFEEDFYIELQRQGGLENIDNTGISQNDVNQILLGFAKKYNIKTIATNDAHYLEKEDALPHDILLCVNTGSFLEDRERFKFPSNDFYFKSQNEMNALFIDIPEAIDNTVELASKVQELDLTRDILLPAFPLPIEFNNQEDYLRHLAYVGAKKRYKDLNHIIEERLLFELNTINNSGYAGYFLIVQDFTSEARKMGVSVGPGRGSAAGSLVAYCLGITNIDPIKYDLLFERFLNPERVSMPDIDIDFDDEGRSKVIDYVIQKYGQNQVAQIVTYGTMAAKSALRDVGRVMAIPLNEVDKVAKTFPSHLSATLEAVLAEKDIDAKLKEQLNDSDLEKASEFRRLSEENTPIGDMIKTAKKLEGSVRNTGIHACGIIITPEDITNYIPVSTAKDSDLLVSQYDNSVAEEAGLLKMDFLGLKTLSIIKDTIYIIKEKYGIDIDIENVDLEDSLTFELFQRGETVGIFQYESAGMQKHLKDLVPNRFEDLIAMNALYRPGPIQYIPKFIARKHGREAIEYDLPEMAEYLEETYGITVYQEQVMLLSQKLADFSKGDADMLRKAMGKKKKDLIDQMYTKFLEGCLQKNYPEKTIEKIWKDWEAFAQYAFNKSHSTCYAFIAFQTAYLKAHYPAPFMAAVLNHNSNDVAKIEFFIQEAKRMQIPVLGPDVNESGMRFSVNSKGQIRFGLAALKGIGEGPVDEIIQSRKNEGPFVDVYDMMRRLNSRQVNKKCMDSLVLGGALDSFDNIHRAQYFETNEKGETFIEQLLKYGNTFQLNKDNNQLSLFGDTAMTNLIQSPEPPHIPEWNVVYKLEKEKEITGIYLSGHPLDDYMFEFKNFINCPLEKAEDIKEKNLKIAGIVTEENFGTNQRGNGYARFTLQDFTGTFQIGLYQENFEKYKHLIVKGNVLYVEGIHQKSFNQDRYFFKILTIKPLETIAEQMTKSITLKINAHQIIPTFTHKIYDTLINAPGKHILKMKIVSPTDEISVDFISTHQKVKVDYSLVKALEEMDIDYKIN